MRKPYVPRSKMKVALKKDWPYSSDYGHTYIPLVTLTSGVELARVSIPDVGLNSIKQRQALIKSLKFARHLFYIHNQAVERKLAENRRIKAAIQKVKQEGKQA